MNLNFRIAKNCLTKAQNKMSAARQGKNQELNLNPNDLVLLKTLNLTMPGKRKFLPRFVGPFRVTKPVGVNAYQLELPSDWKIHNVFNVSLLRSYVAKPDFVLSPARPPDDDYAYIPEKIISHEPVFKDHPSPHYIYKYKVHYVDTTDEEDTWEYKSAFNHGHFELLTLYHAQHNLPVLSTRTPDHIGSE
jgi:hypothetical protein